MPFDLQKLLEMAPLAIGAMKPGSPEAAAMMRGFMRSQQALQQQGRDDEDRQRRTRLDEQAAANLTADNTRADESLSLQRETAQIGRLEKFRDAGTQRAEQLVSGADLGASPSDPSLQNQLAGDLFGLSQQYGVDPGAASTVLPNTTALISTRKKKKAEELYDRAEKTYGVEAMANDSITLKTGPDLFGDVKPSALRAMFHLPATTDGGQVATPFVADPEAKTAGSFDAHFADVLAGEETTRGRKLTRTERAPLRIKAKTEYDAANDRALREPRNRYSVQSVTKPDGTTGLVRVNLDSGDVLPLDAQGMAFGKPSDAQRGALAFYERATAADENAASFEDDLTTLGPQLATKLPNLLASSAGQQYIQAQREFTEARLRKESGAAIPPSEFVNDAKTYFVQPGDTPEAIAQKQAARQRVKRGLKQQSGNLGALQGTSAVEDWSRDANGKLIKKGAK